MPKIINKIIKVLITSDFFLNLGWGLLAPVFAIFILENITPNNISRAAEVAGFAALVYWITKSVIQIPIGWFLDKKHGEKDDFWFMFIGTLITAFVPFGFLMATSDWHIYVFQAVHAIGMAMSLPSWLAIFTRHIDKGKEAFEWGVETTSIGAGAGIAGGLGGIMASVFGFDMLFIFVGGLTLVAALFLFFIKNEVSQKEKNVLPVSAVKPAVQP